MPARAALDEDEIAWPEIGQPCIVEGLHTRIVRSLFVHGRRTASRGIRHQILDPFLSLARRFDLTIQLRERRLITGDLFRQPCEGPCLLRVDPNQTAQPRDFLIQKAQGLLGEVGARGQERCNRRRRVRIDDHLTGGGTR
jgi:hypothetical protein